MDDNNRRRRQNEPPYSAQDPRYASDQSQGRGIPYSISDRHRSGATTGSPSMNRGVGPASAYTTSGYYEPTSNFSTGISSNPLQYSSNYPPDQRQQSSFSDYNAGMMYNSVTQQTPQNGIYDSPQFQGRQPAAMQMMPDVAAPYLSNDPTNTPGTQQYASSNASTPYQHHQQSPGDRTTLIQQSYSAPVGLGGMSQAPGTADVMDTGNLQQQGAGGMEEAYSTYQTALKQIFKNIIDLRLAEASSSLLEVSDWLLGHVVELGLTVDEVALHGDRLRLWNEFNAAWLSIFTKQHDFLESGQRTQPPQTLMSLEFIGKMGTNLTRMCDSVEKYGLVDYQYGVGESQIMDILLSCKQLQETLEGPGTPDEGASANSNVGRAPP
ncbi:6e33e292-dbf6-47f8-b1e0-3d4bbb89c45e [Sclerotinia trifoliorum]|uniref:6e33e292-dbf6-47f8-b1e0-3d4bbb89c45e n=1 Tax=Sclerotinia trifoliorum TaxID=28548 RepID=A0A8H2VLU4_9HELO|nr:6e33e292-dbf6-47f8-b1e0-3d4bbb89c45e [Sclerotinia trifoliorum]